MGAVHILHHVNQFLLMFQVMFNPSTFGSSGSSFSGFGLSTTTPATANPMKDFEVSIFLFVSF